MGVFGCLSWLFCLIVVWLVGLLVGFLCFALCCCRCDCLFVLVVLTLLDFCLLIIILD